MTGEYRNVFNPEWITLDESNTLIASNSNWANLGYFQGAIDHWSFTPKAIEPEVKDWDD